MAEIDYVVRNLELRYSGVFNLLEVYKIIKDFFKDNGYLLMEREHEEKRKELKGTKIKFEASKKVDDYNKLVIRTRVDAGDYEDVDVKNKRLAKGSLTISFDTYIERDYEGYYENKPLRKFLRVIYDRYIVGAKHEKYEKELKDEVYELYNELKEFLNLYKFK